MMQKTVGLSPNSSFGGTMGMVSNQRPVSGFGGLRPLEGPEAEQAYADQKRKEIYQQMRSLPGLGLHAMKPEDFNGTVDLLVQARREQMQGQQAVDYYNQLAQQAAPQVQQTQLAGFNTLGGYADQGQARGQQSALASLLQQAAIGKGPSAAQSLLAQAQEQNANAVRSQIASQSGLSPGLAARLASQGVANANLQSARDAAILGAQEQQQARGLLAQALMGMRGQDQSLLGQSAQYAMGQGGLNQQTNLANLQAALGNRQLALGAAGGIGDMYNLEQARQLQDLINQRMNATQNRALDIQQQQNDRNFWQGLGESIFQKVAGGIAAIPGLGGAAKVAGGALSDERLKTDIKPGRKSLHEFLENAGVHQYRYKNPNHGEGKYVSPMAQELEKSKIGKHMVMETPVGKMVDYGRGFGSLLAAAADMHERIKKLEGKRK